MYIVHMLAIDGQTARPTWLADIFYGTRGNQQRQTKEFEIPHASPGTSAKIVVYLNNERKYMQKKIQNGTKQIENSTKNDEKRYKKRSKTEEKTIQNGKKTIHNSNKTIQNGTKTNKTVKKRYKTVQKRYKTVQKTIQNGTKNYTKR